MGLRLLTCGQKTVEAWAEQDKASISVKQRFCFHEMQAPLQPNNTFIASRYSIKKGTEIRPFCIQVCLQAKPPMKWGLLEELKAESGFYFY